jgi:hypothetical protein
MAAMKKVVRVTGTAKSTSGSSASKNIKIKGLGSSSDKAQNAAAKKKTTATTTKIVKANEIAQYRQGYVDRLQTNRQGDISNWGLGATIADQKGRNEAFNSLTSSAKTAGRAKNVASKLKKAAAAKAAAKKASSPMKSSAASHQKDLAKISGMTAAAKKAAAMRKAKNTFGIMDQTGAAKGKATARTLKSFK